MTAAGELPDANRVEQVIITVHGIRTFGQWQERLGALLVKAGSRAQILHFKYGYFSSIAFLFPVARYLKVLAFARYLAKIRDAYPQARIDLVSHSFGTYVVAGAIRKLNQRQTFRVGYVILSGSVLKPTFPWNELLMRGVVEAVVNECGTKDWILVINQLISLFTGIAGRVGFVGLLGKNFVNNFFAFGHSGYFMNKKVATDDFMRTRWVPLLNSDAIPPAVDQRIPGGPFGGLVTWLIQNSEPIKLSIYLAPLILTSVIGFHLYIRTLSSRLAAESTNELANFPDLSLLLGIESSALNDSSDSKGALISALQRTLSIDHFLWGESSVLMMTPLGGLMDIAFSHSGADAAIGDYGGCVNIYDTRSGARSEHFCLVPETFVESLTYSGDDSKIAIFGGSGLYVWNRKSGRFDVAAVPIDRYCVSELALSSDGKVLVTVSDASVATFWTLDPEVKEWQIRPLPFAAASVTFSPDNHHFAIGGTEGQISIWDLEQGPHEVKSWKSNDDFVESAFNRDGSILATVGDDEDLRMWDTTTFKETSTPIKIPCCANRIEFSKDGQLLAISFSGPRTLRVLDVTTHSFRQVDTTGFAYPFAWSPRGHQLVSAGGHGTAAILDIDRPPTMARVVQVPSSVSSLGFTADGSNIVMVSPGALRRVSAKDAKLAFEGPAECTPNAGAAAAITSDGQLGAITCGGPVFIFDAKGGHIQSSFESGIKSSLLPGRSDIRVLAFDPNNQMLAMGSYESEVVVVRDLKNNVTLPKIELTRPPDPNPISIYALTFSDDSRSLAIGDSDGVITIVSLPARKVVRVLTGHLNAVSAICYDQDRGVLVSASGDSTVRFWSLGSGATRVVYPIDEGAVSQLACADDGLVAGSTARGLVYIWNSTTGSIVGETLKTPDSNEQLDQPICAINGKDLLACYSRHNVFIWDLNGFDLRGAACQIAGRNLTTVEWNQFVGFPMPCRTICNDSIQQACR